MPERDDKSLHAQHLVFGLRVREIRQARGFSQEELADLAGVHRTYLSSLERGQRNIGLDNILALAAALNVSPSDLFLEGTT